MGGIKVVVVILLVMAVLAGALTVVIKLAVFLLPFILIYAIASWLVRQFGRGQSLEDFSPEKDETHSPERTRPSV